MAGKLPLMTHPQNDLAKYIILNNSLSEKRTKCRMEFGHEWAATSTDTSLNALIKTCNCTSSFNALYWYCHTI